MEKLQLLTFQCYQKILVEPEKSETEIKAEEEKKAEAKKKAEEEKEG